MAILKMDVFGYDTTWLPEVDKVISRFHVDPQEPPLARTADYKVGPLVLSCLNNLDRKDILKEMQEYRWFLSVPDEYRDKIVLLKVFRGENVEYWVAPQGRTYLMADDGKTIDRI